VAYHALHDVNLAKEAVAGRFIAGIGHAMGRF
jgi:hypothetical protein